MILQKAGVVREEQAKIKEGNHNLIPFDPVWLSWDNILKTSNIDPDKDMILFPNCMVLVWYIAFS